MHEKNPSCHVEVRDEDDLLALLASVRAFVASTGIQPLACSKLLTVVSELGTNLVKYASNGSVSVRFSPGSRRRLVVESSDEGPGIADLNSAMRDHFSTGGTLGMGLPGVSRLATHFEIQSTPGKGTHIRCHIDL